MFSNIGTMEIVIIALVALLLFGGKKLPELGKSIRGFKKEVTKTLDDDEEEEDDKKKDDKKKQTTKKS